MVSTTSEDNMYPPIAQKAGASGHAFGEVFRRDNYGMDVIVVPARVCPSQER